MNVFRRLYLTTFGSFETIVNRLQNHDAIVIASLKELESRIREALVSFGTLGRTLEKTKEDIHRSEQESHSWTERARREGLAGNKESALECLRRAERATRTREALIKQQERSEASHRTLQGRIFELQNLQKSLTLRHRELQARTEVQEAHSTTAAISDHDVAQLLNRWEDSLGTCHVSEPQADTFETSFTETEERQRLENQLAEMLG